MQDNSENLEESRQFGDGEEYKEYKRMKREEEALANVGKIECDCLSTNSDKAELKQTCKNADAISLGAIVVYPALVKSCVSFLGRDPKTALIAAISYPHGMDTTATKVDSIKRAIRDGVDEVEVCAPVQLIKDGNLTYFKRECKKMKKAAKNIPVRLVFNCSLLSLGELSKACTIAADAGIVCVRLSGADGHVVSQIKKLLHGKCLIKADGVEDFSAFANYCVMGADYLGGKNALSLANLIIKQADI